MLDDVDPHENIHHIILQLSIINLEMKGSGKSFADNYFLEIHTEDLCILIDKAAG